MADLKVLNDELSQARERREALRARHAGATMPEEAREEDDGLIKRMGVITGMIEEEKQRARDAAFTDTQKYMDDPVYKIGRAVNDDDAGRVTMGKAGWELKGNTWHKTLSSGKSIAMYPEEVLVGPLPAEPDAASYVKQVRATMQPEYRDAFVKWMKVARQGGMAMASLTGPEQKALSEGTDSLGGFAVPPDIAAEIGGRRNQASVMRRLGSVQQTTRDVWKKAMIKPNTGSGSRNIYSDDFVAAWVGETPNQSSIDVQFEMFEIPIRKVRAYTLMSNDLISDSVGNLVAELSARGGRSLGLKEDEGFIAGTGSPLEPQGILNHPLARTATSSDGMAYDVEGTTSNTISNSTTDAGSAAKIKLLVYQLPSQYAANASWLMRRTVQGKIASLTDGNGRPFWNSYLESGFSRPQLNIEGFPTENSEFVGNDGSVSTTAATTPLIFGDLSEYQIRERAGLTVRVLQERFGDTDQTGLFLFSRVGGALWNYDAIRTGYIAS